jgi:hypothetical protein
VRARLEQRLARLAPVAERVAIDLEYLTRDEWTLYLAERRGPEAPAPAGAAEGDKTRPAAEAPVTGVSPVEVEQFCAWLGGQCSAGERFRLPELEEARAFPSLSGRLATHCRDGEQYRLACPVALMHGVLVRPYRLIAAAVDLLLPEVGLVGSCRTTRRLDARTRRLSGSLAGVRDLADALARERESAGGPSDDAATAIDRMLPRRVDPSLPRDLPMALARAGDDARALVETAAREGAAPETLARLEALAATIYRAGSLDASGDIGRQSTFCRFIRQPPGIEYYARHVARQRIFHYSVVLALALGSSHAPLLEAFIGNLKRGENEAARRHLGNLTTEASGPSRGAAVLAGDLLQAIAAPGPAAAAIAWIGYVGHAVEQLPPMLERFPVYQDEMARLPVAYELPVRPEEGPLFPWAGVRVVRERGVE